MKSTSAIRAKFLRHDQVANLTKLWEDCEKEARKCILHHLKKHKIEANPIIAFFESNSYFWIISNEVLLLKETECIEKIPFGDIIRLEFDRDFKENSQQRMQFLYDGNKKSIKVETGTWHIVYNMFKFLVTPAGA